MKVRYHSIQMSNRKRGSVIMILLLFVIAFIVQSQKMTVPVANEVSLTASPANYKFTVSTSMKGGNRAFNELQNKGILLVTINRQTGAGVDLSSTDSLLLKLPLAFNITDTVKITSPFAEGATVVKGSNQIVSNSRLVKLSLPTAAFNQDTVKGINKNMIFAIPVVYTPNGQSLAATPELPFRADVVSVASGQEASIGGSTLTIAVLTTSANPYNACSYYPTTMQVTSSGFNGEWYKEASHVTFLSSGSAYSYTPSVNSLDEIIKDMTIPFDAHPHGVPSYYNYYAKPYVNKKFINANGRPPQGYNYFNFWGVAYETDSGSLSQNTLVVVSEARQFIFSIQKNKWIEVANNPIYKAIDGAMFPEAFGTTPGDNTTLAVDPSWRQTDRSMMAAMPGKGKTFHFWPANGRSYMYSPDGVVDYNDIGGFYATFRGKLILKDPNGVDDRSQSRFIMAAGIDHWKNDGTENGSDGMGIGRMKYVTNEWQDFNFTTLTESQLRSMPSPPLPDYKIFYVYAKFGNTTYGTVPVRLEVTEGATITTSNPSVINSGTSIDLASSVSGLAAGSFVKYYSNAAATNELADRVVTPMVTTTYYAQAYTTSGCKSAVSAIVVTVNPSTVITSQPVAPSNVKAGSSFSLSVVATGANLQYQWYKNGEAISTVTNPTAQSATYSVTSSAITDNASYYVVVTGDYGAPVKSASVVVTVMKINNNADLNNIEINNVAISGFRSDKMAYHYSVNYNVERTSVVGFPADANATVSNLYNQTLLPGDNAFDLLVTAQDKVTTKKYTVTIVRDANTTGIADLQDAGIKVYPNPATDVVKIEGIPGKLKNVVVTDASGGKVYEFQPLDASSSANELVIQVSGWGKGMYLLRLTIQPEGSSSLATHVYKVIKL